MPGIILEKNYTIKLTEQELRWLGKAVERGVLSDKKFFGKWVEPLIDFADESAKAVGDIVNTRGL